MDPRYLRDPWQQVNDIKYSNITAIWFSSIGQPAAELLAKKIINCPYFSFGFYDSYKFNVYCPRGENIGLEVKGTESKYSIGSMRN